MADKQSESANRPASVDISSRPGEAGGPACEGGRAAPLEFRASQVSHDHDDPIFVCGAARSGTTVFGLMLRGHADLAHSGEMNFLFERPVGRGDAHALEAFRRSLRGDRIFRSTGFEIDDALDHQGLIRSFVDRARRDGRRLVITLHRNFQPIPELFPNARYIHLVRDPRDVARSTVEMGWSGNPYHGVGHWIATEKDFEGLAEQVEGERILTLLYRSLMLEPARELSRVCAFIGVDYDPAMLDYPSRSTYTPPDPELVEQWRRKLTPREIGFVEGRAQDLMTARGFLPSGHPPVTPGRFGEFALKLHNRAGRIRFSIRRYGFVWTFLEIAGRRAGLAWLAAFAQRKIDDRVVRYLK